MSIKIKNPFKMNDWDIKSFLIVVLSILLLYLGVVGLDRLNIQIPLLRQILGFVYITFIPGYLLLRILRIHNLSSEESFLYAVGLSLFLDMFIGLLINIFYPLLGITNSPMSEMSIILTIILVVGVLSVVAYIRDRDYEDLDYISLEDIINPQVLFLSLIPFMAIFGTYLVNYHNNNILLMLMIVVIALISLIVGFTNWIDEKYHLYTIWVIAISLILHQQLISQTIIINDCVGEFYFAKNITSLGYWPWYDCAEYVSKLFPGTYNSVLSVTVLPTILCRILDISLNWIYKLILPSFYSLLPLSIYILAKNMINNKKFLFLPPFLFISTGGFLKILTITKQLLAQFYVLLVLITFLNSKIKSHTRILLLSVFGFSLVVTHYTTTYLIMASMVFTLIFLKIWKRWIFPLKSNKIEKELIRFLEIFIIIAVGWYMYISQSVSFKSFIDFIQSIWTYEMFDIYNSRVLFTVTVKLSSGITDHILKFLYMALSFFIFIGYTDKLYRCIVRKKKIVNEKDLFLLGFGGFWLFLLTLALVLPSVTSSFDTVRLYQTSLLILCIFAIFGIKKVMEILYTISIRRININYTKISSVFITLLLIFSGTSLVNELTNDNPKSISLSKEKILNGKFIKPKITYFLKVIPIENIASGKWIGKYGGSNDVYRLDFVQGYPSLLLYGGIKGKVHPIVKGKIIDSGDVIISYDLPRNDTLIHLTYQNIIYDLYWTWYNPLQIYILYNYSDIKPIITNSSKVYDNGKSQVYLYQ